MKKLWLPLSLVLLLAAPRAFAAPEPAKEAAQVIRIGSKPFAENYLLAEIFAQLLESEGFPVSRRPGLGSTEIIFGALRSGDIDLYPEYTGTGLLAILKEQPQTDPREVFRHVSQVFESRWQIHWLPPLGFQNTYAVAVSKEKAEQLHLETLSDLAHVAPKLVAGLSPDFMGRPDGLPGLSEAYDLHFGKTRPLLQALKYQALNQGEVDVIDGYSTDGRLAQASVRILKDDKDFFPPYEAAPLVGPRLWKRFPRAVAVLSQLGGRFDASHMRRWNERVEVERESVTSVAADALAELGLSSAVHTKAEDSEKAQSKSFLAYLWARKGLLLRLSLRHLFLVGVSLLAAVLLALPAGLALERAPSFAEGVIRGAGVLQTLPSIALLAFMIPLLGIGVVPALAALFLYSLYPVLRNTYTGVRDADDEAARAATALGMTPLQVLRQVRLPLAAPVIMAGIRTAAVINVGTATLAAFIGAGGLGDPIVSGLTLSDTRMILSGALPAALLALIVDGLLALVERTVAPRGLRAGS